MRGPIDESAEPNLFDDLRRALLARHYSARTQRAYISWARRFIAFFGQHHPSHLGSDEVRRFLDDLARQGVSRSSHQQALCALQFFYRHVFKVAPPFVEGLRRPRRDERLPTVLSRDEVRRVLGAMSGTPKLMASLLYGSGLRLLECARLRIKDLDIDGARITIRDAKGQKDRVTVLPARLAGPLRNHVSKVRELFEKDLANGAGFVELPGRYRASTLRLRASGPGSGFSPRRDNIATPSPVSSGVTTCTKPSSNAPSTPRAASPVSPNGPPATPFATASPPTCSRPATTSAPSKSFSATATSPPP